MFHCKSKGEISGHEDSSIGQYLHNDVVDGNMNEFDEEPNESHDSKTNGSCDSNLLEFLSVWFSASLDESNGILDELFARFHEGYDLIHTR
jgi:hypothetical protein